MKKNNEPSISDLIWGTMYSAGYSSRKEQLKVTGFKSSTFTNRKKNPEQMTLFEFRHIVKGTNMPDETILRVVKG